MNEPTMPPSPLPYDEDRSSAKTGAGGSLVGARRMLFEKQMTVNLAKDCTPARVSPPSPPQPQTQPSKLLNNNHSVGLIKTDAPNGLHVNNRERDERRPVPSARFSRVSIRTLPLNDCAEYGESGDRQRSPSSSSSDNESSQPRSPPSPSLLNDPAFAKRVSYHHAVFKNSELILSPPRTDNVSSSPVCSPKEEDKSFGEENSIPVLERKQVQIAEENNNASDDQPASTSSHPEPIVIIREDLSSAKDSDHSSSLSSSRSIRESVVLVADNEDNNGDENEASDNANTTLTSDPEPDYPEELNPFDEEEEEENENENKITKTKQTSSSYNPFGSDSEEEEEEKSKERISTNPFGSDSEEEEKAKEPKQNDQKLENGLPNKMPVPLPRSVKKPAISVSPQPSPRRSLDASPASTRRKWSADSTELSSRSGSSSTQSTMRKKKPAPPPPPAALAVRSQSSTPAKTTTVSTNEQRTPPNGVKDRDKPASMVTSPWRHKKGPAPARPTPLRRPVKEMPLEDIKTEITDIEIREQELERQSAQLEQMIREKNEVEAAESPAVEEMVLQLFEIINEKNELFRRRSELINMRKMHHLEEEHAELEYQIRCLMLKPASNKTDIDKEKEEQLIKKLLEVVERRNEIIEAMEKDRQRETAEDQSVTTQLGKHEGSAAKSADKKKEKEKKPKKHKKEKSSKEEQQPQLQNGSCSDKEKHSAGQLIKQKFMTMTLRHSSKKLHSKVPT